MSKKIYVDKSAIDRMKPAIVVEDGDNVYRCSSVKIEGVATICYHKQPHVSKENKQNVHVYIETDANLTIE